jgi:hypothetical protein
VYINVTLRRLRTIIGAVEKQLILHIVSVCLLLKKIFGPVQNEDESWRIRMNYELNELIGNTDIVRFIKVEE